MHVCLYMCLGGWYSKKRNIQEKWSFLSSTLKKILWEIKLINSNRFNRAVPSQSGISLIRWS